MVLAWLSPTAPRSIKYGRYITFVPYYMSACAKYITKYGTFTYIVMKWVLTDFVLYLGQTISYSRGAVQKWTGVCRRSQYTERCKYYYIPNGRYRVMSLLKFETDNITNITVSLVRQAVILVIMYVKTYKDYYYLSVITSDIWVSSLKLKNITYRDQRKNSQITPKSIYG